MTEIWKPIKGYEGLYEISNLGQVKSLNYNRTGKEKILVAKKTNVGYLRIFLCKDGKAKRFSIHRLVAETFIENSQNKPYVNHIDCNKQNNCVDNLEWVTAKENMQYAAKLGRMKGWNCKPVIATNIETGEEIYFESQSEAARKLNLYVTGISWCFKGRLNQTGGYTFKYANKDE